MSTITKFIMNENAAHKVVVWAKSHCPHSAKAKELFHSIQEIKNDLTIYDLDLRDDGAEIQDELFKMTGQKTVPNVFVMNQHIGGNDATQAAYKEGKIQKLLGLE